LPKVAVGIAHLPDLRQRASVADERVRLCREAAKSVDRPTEQRPTPTENVATNQQLRISLVETRRTWEKIAGNDH